MYRRILLAITVLFAILQDTALQEGVFGAALASPASIPIILLFSAGFVESVMSRCGSLNRATLYYFVACIFYAIANIFYFFYFGLEAYGQSLLIRGAKIFLLFGSHYYCAYVFYKADWFFLRKYVAVAAIIAFLGVVADILFHDQWVKSLFIHYGINNDRVELIGFDDRIRGFSYESSTLGVTILTLGGLAAGLASVPLIRAAWLAMTFLFLLVCGSKAALPVFLIALVVALVATNGRRHLGGLIGMMSVCSISLVLFWDSAFDYLIFPVLEPFALDIGESTSVATRGTLAVGAFMTAFDYPLGVGFTGYVPGVVLNIERASQWIEALIGLPLNLVEVTKYLVQDDAFAIGAKSFVFDNLIIFGVPFFIFWIIFNAFLLKRLASRSDFFGIFVLLVTIIPLTFYLPAAGVYVAFVAYGWVIKRALVSQIEGLPYEGM